jgi:hypothetical protein
MRGPIAAVFLAMERGEVSGRTTDLSAIQIHQTRLAQAEQWISPSGAVRSPDAPQGLNAALRNHPPLWSTGLSHLNLMLGTLTPIPSP